VTSVEVRTLWGQLDDTTDHEIALDKRRYGFGHSSEHSSLIAFYRLKLLTMKFTALLIAAIFGVSAAFAPASKSAATSALAGEKVPCFGAAPFPGDRSVFFGENYWNKLTSEYGTEDTGKFLRAA
jgi:hypothetical protein